MTLSYAADNSLWNFLLNTSIMPWLWRWYDVPKIWSTSIPSMYNLNLLLISSFLLSVCNFSESALIIAWLNAFLTIIVSLLLIGIAQAYFEEKNSNA